MYRFAESTRLPHNCNIIEEIRSIMLYLYCSHVVSYNCNIMDLFIMLCGICVAVVWNDLYFILIILYVD